MLADPAVQRRLLRLGCLGVRDQPVAPLDGVLVVGPDLADEPDVAVTGLGDVVLARVVHDRRRDPHTLCEGG